jgi:mRNA interferase MazF
MGEPRGSEPGYRRPVLVISANEFNESNIQTVLCAILTTNLAIADAPGNTRLGHKESGLRRDSIVNVSQLVTLDKRFFSQPVRALPKRTLRRVEVGLKLVLGL